MAVADEFLNTPETFRDAETAIMYLLSGLANDFPDATVDVIQQLPDRTESQSCESSTLGPVLEKVCHGFKEVDLTYHPHNAYGFVAEMVNRNGKSSHDRRSRVILLVTHVKGEPTCGGSIPPKIELFEGEEDASVF